MLNEISNRITESYNGMTKSEKKIAEYLLACNEEDAYLSSITEFADNCGVSDGTVSRFCKRLGYSGYNGFKLALARVRGSAAREQARDGEEEDIYSSISPQDDIVTTGNKIRSMYRAAIDQTLELLKPENVKLAASILHQSDRVYCMGQGGSMVISMEAWVRFMTVSNRFFSVSETHLQLLTVSLLTEKDTIWFFSYSGATTDMVDILSLAKERGAKVIAVTRYANSPITQYADVVLICGSNEAPLQAGSIVAKIAILTVIDMVYQEFIRIDSGETEENRELSTRGVSKRML